ncbi:hypothetical protein I2I05_21200 [Hymenobacter sp. BT683]|uniref:Uncharacterized protein n=1 Tax=Hymenobacter jeongseonensis TaxID=2791027 RepID=A0ABS0INJ6_9BACT|nr:hypothetical protein [Hymenobacter jeongseonensis]MBF9239923.1 hypothetical protein [Hymenobacter jeongseonensis]
MKKLLLLLLFPFLASSASFAQDPSKKRLKAKHHYVHASESSKGRTSKARFRPENNVRPTLDLNPKRLEKFKTAKAPKPYTWSKGY